MKTITCPCCQTEYDATDCPVEFDRVKDWTLTPGKPSIVPTYFEGTFPPENVGETNVSVIGLNNGGCIKIYLNDLEEAERLATYIVNSFHNADQLNAKP